MNKNEVKKKKKRNDLLKSAYELFTTIGFQKTTILSIALKAGVGKGTFYLYFDSKEDVRDELIMLKSSQLLLAASDELRKNCSETGEPSTFSEKIIFMTDFIITYLAKDIALLKFISKYLSWGMLFQSTEYSKSNEDVIDFVGFVLSEIKADGTTIREPRLLIFTVLELINSTCYNVILEGEPVTFSEFKPYLYDTIRLIVDNAVVPAE